MQALAQDRRSSVAMMAALLGVPMLGFLALATDMSMWFLEQHRLQIAADAASFSAALQLQNASMQRGGANAYATLVSNEVQAVTGGSLIGTLKPPSVAITSIDAKVTLTSTADTYFVNAFRSAPVTISASARAGLQAAGPCALALNPSADQALDVGGPNGGGSIITSGCPVYSDSSSPSALYVNSGTITATGIGAHGGFTKSSSGSNNVSTTPATNGLVQPDPVSGKYTLPSAGSCTKTNLTYTAYGNYTLNPGTYCGTTTIGGNGSTDVFNPGTYIFTGNVIINNANITSASGVTFVLMGPTPSANAGSFTWQNNSAATLTAPTFGAMAGLLFWQACSSSNTRNGSSNGLVDFNGGSALSASGVVYAPCGTVQLDNNAQVTAASNSSFSVISSVINVWQSASLRPAATNSADGTSQVSLLE